MCLFLETIKIKEGKPFHVNLHQQRMDKAAREVLQRPSAPDLQEALQKLTIPSKGNFKCRVIYDEKIRKVEMLPYVRKRVESLKIVRVENINYAHKYANREHIDALLEQKNGADDIIIVRGEMLTDASYANLVFWNGKQWHTPSTPLLKGIQRSYLLSINKICETEIKISDLACYTKVGLINAMLGFEEMPIIEYTKENWKKELSF